MAGCGCVVGLSVRLVSVWVLGGGAEGAAIPRMRTASLGPWRRVKNSLGGWLGMCGVACGGGWIQKVGQQRCFFLWRSPPTSNSPISCTYTHLYHIATSGHCGLEPTFHPHPQPPPFVPTNPQSSYMHTYYTRAHLLSHLGHRGLEPPRPAHRGAGQGGQCVSALVLLPYLYRQSWWMEGEGCM